MAVSTTEFDEALVDGPTGLASRVGPTEGQHSGGDITQALRRDGEWIVRQTGAPEVLLFVDDDVRPLQVKFGREERVLNDFSLIWEFKAEAKVVRDSSRQSLPVRPLVKC